MNLFQQKFRQTLRSLLRKPGFSILAVLVLALGLGANLLLFNAVQALDATSHLAAIGFLFFGCLLVFLVPVLRAARVNPTEALRSE